MNKEPVFRLNLFAEHKGDNKDWYGFLNIRAEDVGYWIEVLKNRGMNTNERNGDRELTIPVVGFNKESGLPERGIRVEQKLGRKEVNQRLGNEVTRR